MDDKFCDDVMQDSWQEADLMYVLFVEFKMCCFLMLHHNILQTFGDSNMSPITEITSTAINIVMCKIMIIALIDTHVFPLVFWRHQDMTCLTICGGVFFMTVVV